MKHNQTGWNWKCALFVLGLLSSSLASAVEKDKPTEAQLLEQLKNQDIAQAQAAADKLGHMDSKNGLSEIITIGDKRLIESFVGGRSSLWGAYITKEQFDLLYSLLKRPGLSNNTYSSIVSQLSRSGHPNIEGPLFEALPNLSDKRTENGSDAPKRTLANFLSERRYHLVFPYLKEMLNTSDENAFFSTCSAMAKLGSRESTVEAIHCTKILVSRKNNVSVILDNLNNLPKSVPINMVALRKALPSPMDANIQKKFFDLVGIRQENSEIASLLSALGQGLGEPHSIGQAALQALLKFDSEEVWKKSLAEIERLHTAGKMNDNLYGFATRQIDDQLKNPQQTFANHKLAEKRREMEWEKQKITLSQRPHHKLMADHPQEYATEYGKYLVELEKLASKYSDVQITDGIHRDLAKNYFELGSLIRFRLRDPSKAINLYEKGGVFNVEDKPYNLFLSNIMIADTYQYDLRDVRKAITHYQHAQNLLSNLAGSTKKAEYALIGWWNSWLPHEIEYLNTGATFTRKPSKEEVSGFLMVIYFMSGSPLFDYSADIVNPYDPGKTVNKKVLEMNLNAQVPSHFALLNSLWSLPSLPNKESVLAYLKKHDPGGYWSACFLGLAIYSESGEPFEKKTASGQSLLEIFPGIVDPATGNPGPLMEAAQQFMKQRGVAVPKPDPSKPRSYNSLTPLMTAAERGNIESVKTLLKERADVNARYNEGPRFHGTPTKNKTALMFAADRGNYEIVKLLVDAGAELYVEQNSGDTAFSYAVKSENLNVVQYLWKHSDKATFRKNAHTNLVVATRHNLSLKKNLPPAEDMVVYLLKNVADAKSSSQAVHGLTLHGIKDAIKYLLDRGANVELDSLTQASSGGHTDTVRLLLDHGLDPNGRHLGVTPLMMAAANLRMETLQLLISRGADINARDDKGRTVLMHAVGRRRSSGPTTFIDQEIELLKFLIKSGANVATKDMDGKTVIDQLVPEDYYYQRKKALLQGQGQ